MRKKERVGVRRRKKSGGSYRETGAVGDRRIN